MSLEIPRASLFDITTLGPWGSSGTFWAPRHIDKSGSSNLNFHPKCIAVLAFFKNYKLIKIGFPRALPGPRTTPRSSRNPGTLRNIENLIFTSFLDSFQGISIEVRRPPQPWPRRNLGFLVEVNDLLAFVQTLFSRNLFYETI